MSGWSKAGTHGHTHTDTTENVTDPLLVEITNLFV